MTAYIDTYLKNSLPSMTDCLQETEILEWMKKGKTTLIQKDLQKETAPQQLQTITCLPMTWKIQKAQIRERIYDWLISSRLFSEEQKGCRKWTRSTGELLYIDQHIFKESKTELWRRQHVPRKGKRKRTYQHLRQRRCIDTTTRRLHKIAEEDWLQPSETIQTTQASIEQK